MLKLDGQISKNPNIFFLYYENSSVAFKYIRCEFVLKQNACLNESTEVMRLGKCSIVQNTEVQKPPNMLDLVTGINLTTFFKVIH